ncbi:hypothetical protein IAQ61_001220 [Plenodomus lingam]|uniref:uncharacterized protein n=1 Tax=Leptosphaeria maculans TaxID=5022 RepID=UPI00331783FD|nr:hypothetical protein IAQ61_001220 [Plenodomus lingam]
MDRYRADAATQRPANWIGAASSVSERPAGLHHTSSLLYIVSLFSSLLPHPIFFRCPPSAPTAHTCLPFVRPDISASSLCVVCGLGLLLPFLPSTLLGVLESFRNPLRASSRPLVPLFSPLLLSSHPPPIDPWCHAPSTPPLAGSNAFAYRDRPLQCLTL